MCKTREQQAREDLHAALLEVDALPTRERHGGICSLTRQALDEIGVPDPRWVAAMNLRDALMREWPEYSGDPQYPVPAPFGRVAQDAYHNAASDRLWAKWTQYGRSRRRLLAWLIEQTEG